MGFSLFWFCRGLKFKLDFRRLVISTLHILEN